MATIGSYTVPEPTSISVSYASEIDSFLNPLGYYATAGASLVYRRFEYTFQILSESDLTSFINAYSQTMPVSVTIGGMAYTGFIASMRITRMIANPFMAEIQLTIEEQPS